MRRVVWASNLLALIALGIASLGCSTKPTTNTQSKDTKAVKVEPWPNVLAALRKQSDAAGCRLALSQLSADLNAATEPIPTLPDAQTAFFREQLHAAPTDLKELTANSYTNLDSAYLAECLFFRDVARSLDLAGLPTERQAALAFAWACRMVYVRPSIVSQGNQGVSLMPTIPPSMSARRGYGLVMDRAYVFLALAQQIGLDACLVGLGDREQAASVGIVNNEPTRGPFWAVGARGSDGAIHLFDPQRGEALPGTLAQVTSNPNLLKPWFDDKTNPYDQKPDDIKAATVYLAASYSAQTPRMKKLDEQIGKELNVRLAVNLVEQQKLFGGTAKFWAPAFERDPHAYTRVLATVLPIAEGGNDPTPAEQLGVYQQATQLDLIPKETLVIPSEVSNSDLQLRLIGMYLGWYKNVFLDQSPREKLARGQFNEVARQMTELEQSLTTLREGLKAQGGPMALQKWVQEANQVSDLISRARLPQNKDKLPEAQLAEQTFWQNPGNRTVLFGSVFAPIGQAEASVYLALSKHEQAERAQIRLMRSAASDKNRAKIEGQAKDAWANANDAWERSRAATASVAAKLPQRTAHHAKLAARAAQLAANPNASW